MIGMPIVALATTEMSTVIRHGENGIIDTDLDRLVEGMKRLLADPVEARRLGEAGRRTRSSASTSRALPRTGIACSTT